MKTLSLKESFLRLCEKKNFEKNRQQLEIINQLDNFIKPKKNLLDFLFKKKEKLCFYLCGDVGLGKTMIFDHYYNFLKISKERLHFNKFMIKFHNFRHLNKDNSIREFVKELRINKLIYLDEFQVTNIVDAMILGKLFEIIFEENIKVLITSNIKIDDLYKDGLQREQFLPFIDIIKENSIYKELIIKEDYRKSSDKVLERAFSPLNEKNQFTMNTIFRKLTKNKKKEKRVLLIKGRKLIINEYYEGIAKFDFTELCDVNLGAEDYIEISKCCKFILIMNIPFFKEENINQQKRFITLIDILYEKKIYLMISSERPIEFLTTPMKSTDPFKRTISRLFELTAENYVKL